ncbi:importin-5-like protein [Leptotrombidium deliense]|uniref:Importin-5-like protein n=1 Tax=Leptotrombidium deliense TaxID=299467 RepID=A0A443SRI3_9ACAR|nr:importin-5-like protein [Leptotrombidium deliense]
MSNLSLLDFQHILVNLLSSENESRTKAEEQYEAQTAMARAQMLLQTISQNNVKLEVLHLSAVLLRRLIFSSYDEIAQNSSQDVIEQMKAQILLSIRTLADASSKKKLCDAAAELAKRLIDESGNNHWPEFLNMMFECVNSSDVILKECALNMLASVPGMFGNQQNRYLDVIRQMLIHCLSESPTTNLDVRSAAVKATSSFILCHDQEKVIIKHMSDCVMPIIEIIKVTMKSEGEHCDIVLKSVVDIAEKCPQFLRYQFNTLIELCLSALQDPSILEARKHLCIEIIISMAETAPSTIRKRGTPYLGQLVTQLLVMMTDVDDDAEWSNQDVVEEDDFESNSVIGETSLDRLACSVGGKTILPLIISHISQMLQNGDWKHRYAAMMAISAVGEGCHDQMLPLLMQIVDGIIPYLSDAHPRVRYAACNALGQMATDFATDFQEKFHSKVIPKLLLLLDDNGNARVQAHAGAALVNFFEECSPKIIASYLDVVASKLEEVLNVKMKELVEKGTKLVLEQTVVTLASLADSAQEYFERYYDKFVPCLKYIIQNAVSDELKMLRGKSIECISLIGLAVGKEKFCTDASDVMNMLLRTQSGEEQISYDDPQLAYMISAWARICKILGPQFEPYLPFVMGPVLKAASIKIEVTFLDKDDVSAVENDNEWQCISLGEQQTFGIKTAGLEEKATACQMLVCYARELKHGFAHYVEDTVKIMVPLLKFYFHDGVRTAAAESLPFLLECAKVRGGLYVTEMWNYIYPELIKAIESEPEKEVLCEMMTSAASCFENLGTDFVVGNHYDALVKVLDLHLKEHFERSQQRSEKRKDEDYDEGVEETLVDEDDEDVYVLSKVADVLHSCFVVGKDNFLPYFDVIAQHFVNLASPERCWTEHQWTICVVDDIIEHCGPKAVKYKDFFLPLLVSGVQSSQPAIRQASAYGWGVLGKFGGDVFCAECSNCIPLLVQVIQMPDSRTDDNVAATENAIAAVTKILQFNNSQVNVNELLPLWFSWLPIWEDEEELPHVFNFLFSLIEVNHPVIMGTNNSNLPRIVAIIGEVLARNAIVITSDVGQKIVTFLSSLRVSIRHM